MKITLLISTYNNVIYLRRVLHSVASQRMMPYEVIIADDGSDNSTRVLISEFRKRFPVPLIHVWQEDRGFRAGMIRNKAVAVSSGDYIVQIDGDIIIDKNFIFDHYKVARRGFIICGSRVVLSKYWSDAVIADRCRPMAICGKHRSFMNGIRIPVLRDMVTEQYNSPTVVTKMRGCNMGYWRRDFIAVNGYNEDMHGWGYEDNELAIRLINSGIKVRYMKFGGVAYHLYHPLNSRENQIRNLAIFTHSLDNHSIWCENGIYNYLKDKYSDQRKSVDMLVES